MSIETKIKIELLITFAIMFALAFVPQNFETVFFYEVTDCNYREHIAAPHDHWTSQHYIWTWGGGCLLAVQIITMIIRLQKEYDKK